MTKNIFVWHTYRQQIKQGISESIIMYNIINDFLCYRSSTKYNGSGTSHQIDPSHEVCYATYIAHGIN